MEVILKQDVQNLGNKDEIVTVKNGYGANWLIPQGLAVMATPSAKKIHAENMKQRAHKEAALRAEAEAKAAKMEGITVKVAAKVSEKGKVFGSVSNIQVADALIAAGQDVDKKNITLVGEALVKELGAYQATVKIYKDIKATVNFEVVAAEEE
ncbi:MAG: 50S ribosomal protein L9 [Bacteroidales bacterium]|nr:50S ribosomal protein L9 [Candidatus Cacconaster equi]